MNRSTKAALLSGLIIPGLGQIYLKHYRRGLYYVIPMLIYLSIIMYKLYLLMHFIYEIVIRGTVDPSTLQIEIETFFNTQNLYLYTKIGYLIMIIGLISVFDAYYLGKKGLENSPQNSAQEI